MRAIVPCRVVRAGRVADEQVLHLAAAIDEERGGRSLQENVGVGGVEQLHDCINVKGVIAIIGARLPAMPSSP